MGTRRPFISLTALLVTSVLLVQYVPVASVLHHAFGVSLPCCHAEAGPASDGRHTDDNGMGGHDARDHPGVADHPGMHGAAEAADAHGTHHPCDGDRCACPDCVLHGHGTAASKEGDAPYVSMQACGGGTGTAAVFVLPLSLAAKPPDAGVAALPYVRFSPLAPIKVVFRAADDVFHPPKHRLG